MNQAARFRSALSQGRSRDDALGELRRAGATPMECILAIAEVENASFVEAKRLFSESVSWADYVRRNGQALIDELKALEDK
jgi:hypothetical protein